MQSFDHTIPLSQNESKQQIVIPREFEMENHQTPLNDR